jgi:hypothetical protein
MAESGNEEAVRCKIYEMNNVLFLTGACRHHTNHCMLISAAITAVRLSC